jgi:hypothetical protein
MEKRIQISTDLLCMWWEHLTDKQATINEHGKKELGRILEQFDFTSVKDALFISLEKVKPNKDGIYEKLSLEKAFSSIGGICYNRSLNPRINKKNHLINLIKKIHGDQEIDLIEKVVENLFDEMIYIKPIQLQIEVVDKSIFPIVKNADDIFDCLYLIETFIDEKLTK